MKFDVSVKMDKKAGKATLSMTVPYEELKPIFDKAIGIHAKEGEVPGFRKGKVPRPRLIAHFGNKVMNDFALRLLACEAAEGAFEKKKIAASGRVHIDLTPLEDDKPIEFTVTCQVAEKGEEARAELPWPQVGVSEDDEDRPYGAAPEYLRRKT